jgi:hypothetical protein
VTTEKLQKLVKLFTEVLRDSNFGTALEPDIESSNPKRDFVSNQEEIDYI